MKQQEFVLNLVDDIRKQINDDVSQLLFSITDQYRDENGRIRYSLNTDDKTSFIPWNKIKIGDVILVDDHDDPKDLVNRARVDHKYRNCIFTTWLEGSSKGQHHMFMKQSWLGLNGSYPCKVIVPKEVVIVNMDYANKMKIKYV